MKQLFKNILQKIEMPINYNYMQPIITIQLIHITLNLLTPINIAGPWLFHLKSQLKNRFNTAGNNTLKKLS